MLPGREGAIVGGRVETVKAASRFSKFLLSFTLLAFLSAATGIAQSKDATPPAADKPEVSNGKIKLTIALTGGDSKKPVENASVYVKYPEGGKGKLVEMNLKSNMEGLCHAPEIPQGKFLIQVVAPGWKTFGEWYESKKETETINIELVRPKRWY